MRKRKENVSVAVEMLTTISTGENSTRRINDRGYFN
jgi:hypothetical protein